jgi:hypothetical protein
MYTGLRWAEIFYLDVENLSPQVQDAQRRLYQLHHQYHSAKANTDFTITGFKSG